MINRVRVVFIVLAILTLSGCAQTPEKWDYTAFRTQNPRSILIVPVVNRSVDVTAPDYFLATVSRPLAERGYYVFPVNMIRSVLADDGLNDADLVHGSDPARLGQLFGADAVLYISIERWDAKYVVLATTVTVELNYTLKSAQTGQELWKNHQLVEYQPQANAGGGLAGLIANAIVAAVAKAAPNYMPLARQANGQAVYVKGTGMPAGPYDSMYGKDKTDF